MAYRETTRLGDILSKYVDTFKRITMVMGVIHMTILASTKQVLGLI